MLVPFFFQAQNQAKIDSLLKLLKKDNDTNYVNHCLAIGANYRPVNKDSCLAYIHKAIAFSEKKKLNIQRNRSIARLGFTYGKLGRIDEAVKAYERLIDIYEKDKDKEGISFAYNSIGYVYKGAGDHVKAREYYTKSLEVCKSNNDQEGIGIAYYNLGTSFLIEGKYPKALEYLLKAIPIFEELKNYDRMATSYNSVAGVYFLQENSPEAEKFYKKIINIEVKTDQEENIATATFNIGLLRQTALSFDTALVYLNKAMNSYIALGNKQGIADCNKAIGNLYVSLKKYPEAKETLLKGLKGMQETGDKAGMSEVYRYLGEVCAFTGNYDEAISYHQRSLELAKETNFTELIKLAALSMYNTYKLKGDNKNALTMFEMAADLQDTLLNQKSIEEMAALKANFEAEQREREVAINRKSREEIHQTEISKQRALIYTFAIGGIIVLVLLVYAWRAYLQKNKANREISFQKTIIEEKNKNIIDSINYSRNIQQAILPSDNYFKKLLPDSFILYKPKDIVSGDFYFVGSPADQKKGKQVIFGVADCTGHGVPGAFLTLLGKTFIQLGLTDASVNSCAEALNFLNRGVSEILNKRSEDKRLVRDGMDIALCSLNYETMSLGFSGAKNNAYVFRDGEIIELKADKHAIGELNELDELPLYADKDMKVEKGDVVYLFSDGFVDQFGGTEGKKFKSKNLKERLKAMKDVPMDEQKRVMEKIFDDWKGSNEQVDDVCLMGIRI
jgi:tetratricopeptide (TPR) repeat protein